MKLIFNYPAYLRVVICCIHGRAPIYGGQKGHFAIAHSAQRIRVSHIVFARPIAYSHIARSLFAYRISHSRPIAHSHLAYRIRAAHGVFAYRISHIAFARPMAYISHSRGPECIRIAYRIRATHNVLHIAYNSNRAVHGAGFLSKHSLGTRPLSSAL